MNTKISNMLENGIHIVGAYNTEEDYVLWQKSENEHEINFEWNSQSNSGYDIVKECTLDRDGMHIVLKDSKMLHFYFSNCLYLEWKKLSDGLQKIYISDSDIIDIQY